MKFAIFTFDGYGLPVAQHLQDEGEDVIVGMVEDICEVQPDVDIKSAEETDEDKARRLKLYDGIVEKQSAKSLVKRLLEDKNPGEWFVFLDLNHLFRIADALRGKGFAGNFPTSEDFCYEIDRERAKDFVERNYGLVNVAAKHRFAKVEEAKAFLESSEEIWVLKGLLEDARTVVPDVSEPSLAHLQLLDALQNEREDYEAAGFILELMIPNALELTPAKIYKDGNPVYSYMCIENKPLGAGNVGPMTDCAQDLVFATDLEDKINKIAFPPIVDEMARQHEGLFFWDASLYADPRTGKIYFGEFCANRPGYSSLYTEMALAGSASKFFTQLAAGKPPYASNVVAGSVRMFNLHQDKGDPLAGSTIAFTDRAKEGLWLLDAQLRGKRIASVGFKKDLAVATGSGHSVSEAAKRAYRNVDEFSFEGSFYRPLSDFLSHDYNSSILNRLDYGLQRGLYKVGFGMG